jgi:malonyl CoA-acyl carrier protein transacylase
MFPGQGSQFPGMAVDLFKRFPEEVVQADRVLGYSIAELCSGNSDRLNDTTYTQPAIFLVSCLAFLLRRQEGHPPPDIVIGHSLGLYACLFAAEVFDLSTGLEIVAKRGSLMGQVEGGGMLAVIGALDQPIEQLLLATDFHDVDVANYNHPTQVVLSGERQRIVSLKPILEGIEGIRCVVLPVSGAFHSRYMETARRAFTNFLTSFELNAPRTPIISAASGELLHKAFLLEEMGSQLVKPVRWLQAIGMLKAEYPDIRFEEIGPNNILTGLTSQIPAAV